MSKAKESIDFNDFLHSPDHRKNILLQSVGAGKTFWLTELVKYATINGVPVKFFRADEISSEMLREDGEIYTIYQDQPETVFCFDSIDEIKSRFTSEQNEKEMIKQELIRWP